MTAIMPIFDAILDAGAPGTPGTPGTPCPVGEHPAGEDHLAGEDALEPFCTECGARAGIFVGRGGDWLHYTGEAEDDEVQPYDTDHVPVIGWRPVPGIVVVAR